MIHKLSEKILFGDFHSVYESRKFIQSIINVGAHDYRQAHYRGLAKLNQDIWYFRLIYPGREDHPPDTYLKQLHRTIEQLLEVGKTPILCHCRHGLHRGPAAALLAFWHDNGQTVDALEFGFNRIVAVMPIFAQEESETNQMFFKRAILEYIKARL
jgi:hypothetical protein